jgi:hypothetical protein
MALNLENVDERVNSTLESKTLAQQVTEAAEAARATPEQRRHETEVRALQDELAALKRESAHAVTESEVALSEARLKVAKEQAHSIPATPVRNAMADIELSKAIAACKGVCFWNRLTFAQKEAALNIQGGAATKDTDIKKIFGRTSDSAAANALSLSNPAEYKRLRLLAKVRGLY